MASYKSSFCLIGSLLPGVVSCGGKESGVESNGAVAEVPTESAPAFGSASANTERGKTPTPAVDAGGQADAGNDGGSPAPGVVCGAVTCASPTFCLICDPTIPNSARSCETEVAKGCPPPWGQHPPLRVSCDGQEDCKAGERCLLFEGSLGTYTQCMQAAGGSGNVVCRIPADCTPSPKACEPYNSPDYPVRVCK